MILIRLGSCPPLGRGYRLQEISRLNQKMVAWQLNFGPLKEPLGFIKLLEWFASIFSFATCGGYSGKTEIIVECAKLSENKSAVAPFMYPFRLNVQLFGGIPENFCNATWKELHLTGDYSSPAQFYVSIGVFAFLYCMAALAFYLGFMHLYRDSRTFPLCDFFITVIFAVMWLVSSSAWAKGLSDIKTSTSPQNVVDHHCPSGFKCLPGQESHMGSLNISVAFGFLNLILWAGNAWFVYKETSLHSPPQQPNPEQGPGNVSP
ncbi:synaptophysin-like protein 1 isoform X1 [Xenopus laevis]|uniref:Synaptophysin-like protein 1 isoform X1 n=1 Tax=Xenopus laevis TaxID=8355 RepID=A0A8J0UJ12_XENLA|nr:synaptophysin-like protein 1 isoform X1 [Xenopus laevis]